MARQAAYHKEIIDRMTVLFAEFNTDEEIRKTIKSEFGVELRRGYAKAYFQHPGNPANRKMLALRETFCKGVMSVPIAQKVVRLQRLEKIYHANKDSTDKDMKVLAIRALSEARSEVDGNSKVIQFLQFNKFEGKTDDELLALRNKLVRELGSIAGDRGAVIDTQAVGVDRSGIGGAAEEAEDPLLCASSDPVLFPHLQEAD